MSEKIINVDNVDLITLFGENNQKFNKLKNYFPELKLISRGDKLKVLGNNKEINRFIDKINLIINHIDIHDVLTENQMEDILLNTNKESFKKYDDIVIHSYNGKIIKAQTKNQRKIIAGIKKNDMLFVTGPAGTGKTYIAVALAVKALKEKRVKRIILTRPAIEAGENLGFLPGDMKEKLDPYMQPLYDALLEMLPPKKIDSYIEKRIIQIAPLAFMRGRTLNNAFVILDEAQNTTLSQMKMFLTRMGASAKFIITGDQTQIDLPKNMVSGLLESQKVLKKIKSVGFIKLEENDIFRHKIVKQIIQAYKSKKIIKNE
ncbi:MAG: PhoH family protein [Bacteroidota bacterium]|nr:PhoH family protein [Bacteroidota bacterium]